MTALLICVIAAATCQNPVEADPISPAPPLSMLSPAQRDSISLSYICGNTFRIRNPTDSVVGVAWQVHKSDEQGELVLPPKPPGQSYSETLLTTQNRGELRVYYGTQFIERATNHRTICEPEGPVLPPDNVPSWFADDSSYNTDNVLKNVVVVHFARSSSAAERQAAIDEVRGTIIGGAHISETQGLYYVLVPADLGEDPVRTAIDILRTNSVVVSVAPRTRVSKQYRKPIDGLNWREWTLRPDGTLDENWGLEAVRLPLAWGCEVGSATTRIGVVDNAFDAAGELVDNVAGGFELLGKYPEIMERHGTAVASILGAPGNNGLYMTGVMWDVALDLRDYGPGGEVSGEQLVKQVIASRRSGARIINVSAATEPITDPTYQQFFALQFALAMESELSEDSLPLLIFAAGNHDSDARVASYPLLRGFWPKRVIVVGGIKDALGTLSIESNYGELVDLYAPGQNVYRLAPSGEFTTVIPVIPGNSFAAPFVTGIAGLVESFDPTLPLDLVYTYVIEGAAAHGLSAAGPDGVSRPVVDAYGALTRAAQAAGAPLCGNRVFARPRPDGSGADIYAERDQTLSPELIATTTVSTSIAPMLFHGGRRFDDFYTDASFHYNVATRSFEQDGWSFDHPFNDGDDGGTYNSANGITHDGKSILRFTAPRDIGGMLPTGRLIVEEAGYSSRLEQVTGSFTQKANIYIGTDWSFTSFNAPISTEGDTAYIALGGPSGWRYVGLDLNAQVAFPLFPSDTSGVWVVDWLAVSEDGREMVAREYEQTPEPGFSTCRVIFRNLDPQRMDENSVLVPLGQILRPADPEDCGGNYWSAAISPLIASHATSAGTPSHFGPSARKSPLAFPSARRGQMQDSH